MRARATDRLGRTLSVVEMTAVIGHVVGHKVRHVRTPLWMFYKAAKAQGLEPILLSGLRYYFQDHDRGAFAVGAPKDTVRELTGRDAEDFETIARRHAALPESRHNPARGSLPSRASWRCRSTGVQSCDHDRAQESPCGRHRISRSTTPTGRRATASRARWWCKVR